LIETRKVFDRGGSYISQPGLSYTKWECPITLSIPKSRQRALYEQLE